MSELVDWLCGVEERVAEIYRKSAVKFLFDPGFAAFLKELDAQEMDHSRILREAFAGCEALRKAELGKVIDGQTRNLVDAGLDAVTNKITVAAVSKEELAEIIADIEFHEWNGIFLYVMSVLKGYRCEYARALAALEKHLGLIEAYFGTFPQGRNILEKVRQLSSLGRFQVLVVEDEPALAELVRNVLVGDAVVTIAHDGRDGLQRIRAGAFDVIVSDVDMPLLNGVELFREAVRFNPDLNDRFVFLTANHNPEVRKFFADHGLPVLDKPSPIDRIRRKVLELSNREPVV